MTIQIKYKNKNIHISPQKREATDLQTSSNTLFYNATTVFKALDLPPSQEPDKWLRSNDTKAFILTNCTKLNPDVKTEQLNKLFYQPTQISKQKARMTRLPQEIESEFTFQVKGRSGGTYMIKELFLKYMAYLDKDLEWQVIEAFFKYGHLDKLSGDQKTRAFLDLAANSVTDTLEKATGEKPTKERTLARLDGMVKQRSLTQILCSILFDYGFIRDKELAENFFRKVYIGIYETCFGQNKEEMLELLERKSGLIRDFMSDDALDILNMAETTIHVQLSLAKRAGVPISWDFIYDTILDSCKIASTLSFKYTDHIPFLHRAANKKFKKEIDVTLNNDMSITKTSKKIP
jgi:hypothetical protein